MVCGVIVGGGAIANDMAEGSKNEGLATVLGAFIGGVMGQSIGSQLDELDRQMALSAYNEALEYNRSDVSTDWVNPDSGNSGSFTPTRTYTKSGRYCREYTQEIIIGGQIQTGYGTACRQPDGKLGNRELKTLKIRHVKSRLKKTHSTTENLQV